MRLRHLLAIVTVVMVGAAERVVFVQASDFSAASVESMVAAAPGASRTSPGVLNDGEPPPAGATAVAAGFLHTCALTTAGGVVCWGSDASGQLGDGTTTQRSTPVAVSGLETGVAAIGAGYEHTCALTTAGGVLCWGTGSLGQLGDGTTATWRTPRAVSGLASGVTAVAVGQYHTCALKAGGVMCWGYNGFGQLGDGTTTQRSTPVAVSGLESGVAAIGAGSSHTCAVTMGGGVPCWGKNDSGQLGDGTTTNQSTPTAVSGLASGVTAVATGSAHTCALKTGDGVLCWGDNGAGQLGDGTMTNRLTPTAVSGLASGVTAVAVGQYHTCALKAGGVMCWGYNGFGQLGDGTTTNRSTPTAVSGLASGATSVAGYSHTCAVTMGGGVLCWGFNVSGQLGDGTTTNRSTPTASGLASGVTSVAAGDSHTCALTTAGGVLCWGRPYSGQLGDGTTMDRSTPTPVSGLSSGATSVAAGSSHTCALTTAGGVLCWGFNDGGQLGDGTTTNRSTPTAVSGLASGAAAISAGWRHTCALTTGGGVMCWGRNDWGQLGSGTATYQSTPTAVSGLASGATSVAAGYSHTCAVTMGGGVLCWGSNAYGQLGDGTTTSRRTPTAVSGLASGVTAVTTGQFHTCAVTSGGGVVCWGRNESGQLGDGTITNRLTPTAVGGLAGGVTRVAGGYYHTCVLTTGAGVACWGSNRDGELGDGTTTSRRTPTAVSSLGSGVAAVAAGYHYTCALTTGGGVVCWGSDDSGQLGLGTRNIGTTPVGVYGFGGVVAEDSVTPACGPSSGGTLVTITGAYFLLGATVTIGGVPATNVTVVNTEIITATTGAHGPGAVDVVVQNPDGTQATLADGFTYGGAGGGRADFTGDLKSDILWRHSTFGEVWLWPMDCTARTAETYVRTVADTNWEIRGLGDQTGDGKADILWRHKTTGEIYLWPMDGSTPVDEIYVATVDPAYDIVGTGDYNGDGKSDILWRHLTNGEVWIWLMDGATPLVGGQVRVDTVDPAYVIKGSGDLNLDGKSDIVWHHATTGEVWVWLMSGTTRTSQTHIGTVPDVGYEIVGVADHTGDGKGDILWHHTTRGDVWIWPMDGTTRLSETWVGTVPDTGYQIVGSGDYDGDGKADILWHHATLGEVWVWLMDGATRLSQTWVGTVPNVGYEIIKQR